jgi:hypothetical protein
VKSLRRIPVHCYRRRTEQRASSFTAPSFGETHEQGTRQQESNQEGTRQDDEGKESRKEIEERRNEATVILFDAG